MGGRGATMISHYKHNDNNPTINMPQEYYEDDPETDIHNRMFNLLKRLNWSTRKSTDILDELQLRNQQQVIKNLTEEYSNIFKNVLTDNEIKLRSINLADSGCLGVCGYNSDQNNKILMQLVLDRKYVNSTFREKYLQKEKAGKYFSSVDYVNTKNYIVTHEMGHALEYSIAYKMSKQNADLMNKNLSSIAYKIRSDVISIARDEILFRHLKRNEIFLSKYSDMNQFEWFAETFANLKLSSKPEPIAKALQLYLERLN